MKILPNKVYIKQYKTITNNRKAEGIRGGFYCLLYFAIVAHGLCGEQVGCWIQWNVELVGIVDKLCPQLDL
jgi:hypothetical protein